MQPPQIWGVGWNEFYILRILSYANKIYIFLNFRKNVVQKNFVLVNRMIRKNFRSILRHDWSQKSRKDVNIDFKWPGELFSVSMTFQKSPFACLCAPRIWSKHCTTPPFALGDRYDHEKACKHKFYVMESYRKCFEGRGVFTENFSSRISQL